MRAVIALDGSPLHAVGVREKMLISISNAPVKQAMMPMIARAANEMTPVLVIFCSIFCGFVIVVLFT